MNISKCTICRNRKGKRFCPEQNAMICASCCGKRIHNQSGCPQNCMYFVSSQNYRKHKDVVKTPQADSEHNIDWPVIGLMERCIYERLKNDIYYEDRDILQGIERKINALEHPEIVHEVLLNRSGVIESALDEMIRRINIEESFQFSNERVLRALRSYARQVRHLGSSRKGGQRYIEVLKKRIAEIEERLAKDSSKGEEMSGYPLISLPFGQ